MYSFVKENLERSSYGEFENVKPDVFRLAGQLVILGMPTQSSLLSFSIPQLFYCSNTRAQSRERALEFKADVFTICEKKRRLQLLHIVLLWGLF